MVPGEDADKMTTASNFQKVRISDIRFDVRHRKDFGEIETLAESINRLGLLHPVVLRSDMTLIAGERRIRAYQHLGRDCIEAHIVKGFEDAVTLLLAERDENTERKALAPSEKVALGIELEKLERPKASERKKSTQGNRQSGAEKFSAPEKGDTRDKVGGAIGMSGVSYQRAKAVVKAAEEDPEQFGDLVEQMDATGKITPAHDELTARRGKPNITARQKKRPVQPRTRRLRSASAAKAIPKAVTMIYSISTELLEFDVAEACANQDDAMDWEKELAASVSSINRFRKSLKEHLSGKAQNNE